MRYRPRGWKRKSIKERGVLTLTVKVEEVGVEGGRDGLVVRVVVCLEVRVAQRLLDRQSLFGVDCWCRRIGGEEQVSKEMWVKRVELDLGRATDK